MIGLRFGCDENVYMLGGFAFLRFFQFFSFVVSVLLLLKRVRYRCELQLTAS